MQEGKFDHALFLKEKLFKTWFNRLESVDEDELDRAGLLIRLKSVDDASDQSFLLPLVLCGWAQKKAESSPLAKPSLCR